MEELYYIDPYIKSFTTNIVKSEKDNIGLYVVLEQTAFYPTGGGQPHDIGWMNGVRVTNVEKVEDEIRHYIEEPLTTTVVDCTIDWQIRWDHMQQHTGQHILSAAFANLFQFETTSFHLGNEVCTIDLNTENINEEELQKVEVFANNVILENRPISTKWITNDEISQYPLRKEPKVKNNIRLVIIPEIDYNACGGTHPNTTGEILMIKILHVEKSRNNSRVTFISGKRVIEHLHRKHKILSNIGQLLSSPEEKIVENTTNLLVRTKVLEEELEKVRQDKLHLEAEIILNNFKNLQTSLICKVFEEHSINELQKIAKIIISKQESVIILFVSTLGDKLQVVCGKSKDMPGNMNALLKTVLPTINGKGGGSEWLAQGGGAQIISPEQLINYLENNIKLEL